MDKITRKFSIGEVTFEPLTVGWLKHNPAIVAKVQSPRRTLSDVLECTPFIQASSGLNDEQIGKLTAPELSEAINAGLEASGFVFGTVSTGEGKPAGV